MKFVLGLILALQMMLAPPSWGQPKPAAQPIPQAQADDEVSLPGRRYAISNNRFGVVLLDTVPGSTWRLIVTTALTAQCKGQRPPMPSECEVWGWEPMIVFK